MKTVFVSAFTNICTQNNRTFQFLKYAGDDVLVLSTDFSHRKKQYYDAEEMNNPLQINLHVPSYKKNLGLKRIWSHIVFAYKVNKHLNTLHDKPNALYCTMPTSSSAYVCARYCKKNGIKFIIDVIDIWPDSLLPLVNGKNILKILLYPWTYLSRYAYRSANIIIGESVKYAYYAKQFNVNAPVYPIYLGVDTSYVKKIKEQQSLNLFKPEDEIWIGYAGSLGTSYDFDILLKAVHNIKDRFRYKLWFIGDGVRHSEIQTFINNNGLNAEITGFLPYEQLLGYLSYCDIAVNIFRKNTKVVYSYKFNDYVAMSCFVLNSLEGETAEMIDKYSIGRNFDFSDHSLPEVLDDTLEHWDFYSTWKKNVKQLIDEKLDKEKIYSVVENIFK